MNEKTEKWHEITVTLPKEGSDWISHLLIELGSIGNLEEDSPDPALIAMRGYFPVELGPDTAIIQQITELLGERGIKPLSTYSTSVKIQNWAENAQQLFSPIKILDNITIINPWTKYECQPEEKAIVINPGMAFGTGLHATTQLAAQLMAKTIRENGASSMCDVGCGSAILSIIAITEGVNHVDAVEIDSDARISAEENIARNGCDKKISLLDNLNNVSKEFDLVVANILCSTILELKNALITKLKAGGHLVLSGITVEEDAQFTSKLLIPLDSEKLQSPRNKSDALQLLTKKEKDGWMGYLLCRNS